MTTPSSDEKLRDLERRFRQTGSPDDEAAWLLERHRSGQCPKHGRDWLDTPCDRCAAEINAAIDSCLSNESRAGSVDPVEILGRHLVAHDDADDAVDEDQP